MADSQLENLTRALKSIQQLKHSVRYVFQSLSEGVTDRESSDCKDKFLNNLQNDLSSVHKTLNDLSNYTTALNSEAPSLLATGNSSLIALDPIRDKTPCHVKLTEAYKWSAKVIGYSNACSSNLAANSLLRSSTKIFQLKKMNRRILSRNLPSMQVDSMIQAVSRQVPDLNMQFSRPGNGAAQAILTVGRVMKVVMVFSGSYVDHVFAKGLDESLGEPVDYWSESEHEVFRVISDHLLSAIQHCHQIDPWSTLRHIVVYARSYANLFTQPCASCGSIVRDHLPPTWRDYRSMQPFHLACKV